MNTTPGANTPGPATASPSPAPGPSAAPAPSPASSPGSGHGADPGTRAPEPFVAPAPSRGRAAPTPQEVSEIVTRGQDPNYRLNLSEVSALLGFDTFGDGSNPPAHTGQTPSTIDAPPATPATAAPTPQEPAAPALPTTPQAFVEAVREVVGQAQQPQAPASPQEPQRAQPYYGGTVPALEVTPELFGVLMNAENPQQSHQAMNFLVNSMMNRVMEDAHRSMLSMAKAIMTNVPKMIPPHIQASSVQDKFNAKFPELSVPLFQEMIKTMAGTLAQKRREKGLPLDDSFIAELGEHAHKFLETATGKSFRPNSTIAPTPPQTTPVVAAPPAPPRETFYTNGGARPNGGATPPATDWRSLVL